MDELPVKLRDILQMMKLADEVPLSQVQHDRIIDIGKKYLNAILGISPEDSN